MTSSERAGVVVGIVNFLVKMMLFAREEIVAQIERQHVFLRLDLVGVVTVKHAVAHCLVPILRCGKEEKSREAHSQLLVLIEDRGHGLALI